MLCILWSLDWTVDFLLDLSPSKTRLSAWNWILFSLAYFSVTYRVAVTKRNPFDWSWFFRGISMLQVLGRSKSQ